MRKLVLSFLALIISCVTFAQQFNMGVEKPLTLQEDDLEQKAYSKVKDGNDNLCALIKVRLTNSLPNPLILEVGGLGVTKAEERPDGEYWFFVPYQVKNLEFRSKGYAPMPKIPVNLKEGCVYTITLRVDASTSVVTTVQESTNYLKILINPADAQIKIGRSKTYEMGYQIVDAEGWFSSELDYGTWYYQIEHDLYKTYSGSINLDSQTQALSVKLEPNYSTLGISSNPSGAVVYLDNKKLGGTPYSSSDKIKKGKYRLTIMKTNYYSLDTLISINGDGRRQDFNFSLRPQFGFVSISCQDRDAELWIDKKMVGKGSWQGDLSSQRSHVVEARKAGHQSQSISLVVKEGGTVNKTVGAPVPLYGTLNVDTNPKNCKVYIDGNLVGNSPLKQRLLVGEHKVKLEREGYRSISETVNIEHNKTLAFKKTLEKGEVYAPVTIHSVSGAKLYCDGNYLGNQSWSGKLTVGSHKLTAVKDKCKDSALDVEVLEKSSTQVFSIPAPAPLTGSLSISGVQGAKANIKDTEGSYQTSVTLPYSVNAFPIGTYSAYATKSGYYDSDVQYFNVEEGRPTRVFLNQKRISKLKKWVSAKQYYAPSVWELIGGWDFDSGFMYGLSYTYLPKRIGAYASYLRTTYADNCFMVGPALRLSNWPDNIDFQLYGGVGWDFHSGYENKMVYDLGLRMNFDDEKSWSHSSISAGCAYIDESFYPYVGLSLGYPWILFGETDREYCAVFSDLYLGIGEGDCLSVGLNTAWVPTHLGAYANIMYDTYGYFYYGGGLVWRLSSTVGWDFQLYGGLLAGNGGAVDLGCRFGLAESGFSYLDFLFGVTIADITYINIGFSIALAAMAFAYMY
ncbi:MAG: PEGA domain-containing protein [Candidatus Cryptobacteroides sp.]